MNQWPSQAAVLSGKSIYGNPMNPKDRTKMSPAWERANIVLISPAFRMTYAGTPIKKIRVHKHCAQSLSRVLGNLLVAAKHKQETLDHWGVSIFGGVVNYRLMRGGNRLSMHSYGCAIDLDPARNGMYDRTPRFAEFPEVLAAFAKEGWLWGGDWNGNGSSADERAADGMHWQATR
jgi:hypothetical protein